MIKGEKLIYRSDEGTYDGRAYSFLEVWMRKNKSTYIKVWFGYGKYAKYELQPLIDAFIQFLGSCKEATFVDTDNCHSLADESFEEYCQRKSKLGSVYGSTNKEDASNE